MRFQFGVAVAVPPSNDIGSVAIVDGKGGLVGFNVTAGGGMGVTHGKKKPYSRVADALGFCTRGKTKTWRGILGWSNEATATVWGTFFIQFFCRAVFPDAPQVFRMSG